MSAPACPTCTVPLVPFACIAPTVMLYCPKCGAWVRQ